MRRRAEIFWHVYRYPELFCPRTLGELVGVSAKTARKHLRRFEESINALKVCAAEGNRSKLERLIEDCLQDAPRTGRPQDFTPLQIVCIISIACEKPELSGRPISKWTSREIADEAKQREIVTAISASHVARILRSVNLKPHKTKGWCFTTEKDREAFLRQAQLVCEALPASAAKLQKSGHSYGRFIFTPKHSSWLNQIEVIFGIINRRALAGASFGSQQELIERLSNFIDYFNTTFARPMNWTYTGRPTEDESMEQPLTWRQRQQPKRWKDHWNEREEVLAM